MTSWTCSMTQCVRRSDVIRCNVQHVSQLSSSLFKSALSTMMVFLVVESVYDGVHPGVHVADPQDAEVQIHRSIIFL